MYLNKLNERRKGWWQLNNPEWPGPRNVKDNHNIPSYSPFTCKSSDITHEYFWNNLLRQWHHQIVTQNCTTSPLTFMATGCIFRPCLSYDIVMPDTQSRHQKPQRKLKKNLKITVSSDKRLSTMTQEGWPTFVWNVQHGQSHPYTKSINKLMSFKMYTAGPQVRDRLRCGWLLPITFQNKAVIMFIKKYCMT